MRRRDKRRRLKKASAGDTTPENKTPAAREDRNPQDGDRRAETRRSGLGVAAGLAEARGQNPQIRDPLARKATES